MPQMAPMNWSILHFLLISLIILTLTIMYTTTPTSLTFKIYPIKTPIMTWKW